MNKCFLFDMDGVMVDVSASYRVAIKQTCYLYFEKILGKKLKNKLNWGKKINFLKARGNFNNDWDLCYYLLKEQAQGERELPDYKIIKEMFQEIYLGEYFEKFYLRKRRFWFKKGLHNNEKLFISKEIFSHLAKSSKLGIVTGRPKDDTLLALQKFGLKKFFKVVITEDDLPDIKFRKPNHYPLSKAVHRLRAEKDKIFYFGDNVDDMKMAIAAKKKGLNMKTIGCVWNKAHRSEVLKKAGADAVLRKPAEILSNVGS